MGKWLTVTPAYGADYKSAKAAKDAWEAGHDFRDTGTMQYCSKRDFANEPPEVHVHVRYNKLTRLVQVR